MNANLIFWPVLAQIALTIITFLILGVEKAKAIKMGNVDMDKAALDNDAWPEHVLRVSNNMRNQFQLPVLFYVLSFMFFSLNAVSAWVVSLAWVFVASRLIHSYIHIRTNYVPARFRVFSVGFIILMALLGFAAKALAV